MRISRRSLMKLAAGALPALWAPRLFGAATASASPASRPRSIAPGPFQPTWESLRQYRAPDWFRDAKFGLWNHWSAQCVPEQGDWYARQMYIQGHPQNRFHVATYGHPSEFGFMEIDNLWKAEKWDPEALMDLYVKAGAKYFVALANHHDNFDNYDSTHHEWNSVRVGPKKDLIAIWAKAARARGLRFGVTNHSAHSWHWFQTAYGYDPTGDKAGVRYDAYRLTREDGKGKWWEGLDPQALYNGRIMPLPDGITTLAAANNWHNRNDRVWNEAPPPDHPEFVERWFLRCQELIDKYAPDLLYFDNTELPLGQAGLDIAAHFYNASIKAHGRLEAVLNSKQLIPAHAGTMVLDIERGSATDIRPDPWQTDTCIGGWHYDRSLFTNHRYKSATQVIQMLIDIVSKNGNLLLNIPLRGDGSIDDDERNVLADLASWVPAHGDAIFATRPWKVYGEGPSTATVARGQFGGARDVRPYAEGDIRFTCKGGTVFAFLMAWPAGGTATIKSLAADSPHYPGKIARVELLTAGDPLPFTRTEAGLAVTLPATKLNPHACALKITPGA